MQCSHAGRHTHRFGSNTGTEASDKPPQSHKYHSLIVLSLEPLIFSQSNSVYIYDSTHCFMLLLLNHIHQPTQSHVFFSRPQHCMPDVGCYMSGRKQQCCLETPPQSPCLQLNQSARNRVFHLQSIWNWGNQPDVQSCLLKQSPCLGFGSWTDSQPCGMAAVEGLFKLHPGWWVAVRRAMDREFRKGKKKRDGRAGGGVSWAGRTVTLTPRCTGKEMSWTSKKKNEVYKLKAVGNGERVCREWGRWKGVGGWH